MTNNSDEAFSDTTVPGRVGAPPRLLTFRNSPAVKFILIGLLTILLLAPATFVWVLVEERADRARDVARDIARSWGGTQKINGPYLVVPYDETALYQTKDGQTERRKLKRTAVFFPKKLDVSGDIDVEERQKSIYSLPVYHSRLRLSGRFAAPELDMLKAESEAGTVSVNMEEAYVVVGIGDISALKSEVLMTLDGAQSVPFEPGLGAMKPARGYTSRGAGNMSGGINASVPSQKWRQGFTFDIDLQLNGSSGLFVAPSGQTTKVSLASNWPHPGFTGAFLPEERTISEEGFEATWTIPYLARGIPKLLQTSEIPLENKLLGVKFVEPVNFYQTISRSLKYAVGFISLTFLAVFVLEMRSGWSFHWIQYGLVGFALIIFYVMLLAFAEHVGYGPAYLIAAGAATLLNAVYVGTSLRNRFAGVVMLLVLGAIFGVLFALMREQDYALLIGSVIAFVALAVTMFVTQRIDWSGSGEAVPRDDSNPA
ncbi:cell envelope integrity protein CreD [Roseibium aggregatum]|uniref:Cell envelope integrity protein CreD n=1 Tax=Roseibium aggregatum TaxID=187304 RepID=A0A939EGR2_9HYPH|nr:cell envelope integrity protein CreD [Roseibium aggregatum]MBN9672830.1 cell envelope integrity protein CreD [Roseibium aggregatum]